MAVDEPQMVKRNNYEQYNWEVCDKVLKMKFHLDKNIPSTPQELENIIASMNTLANQNVNDDWFLSLSELQCLFNDAWFYALWQKSQDSSSLDASTWYKMIIEKYVPQFEAVFFVLNNKVQQAEVTSQRLERIKQRMNTSTTTSQEEIDLLTQINLLASEYEDITSKQVIDLDGSINLAAARLLLGNESDSNKRRVIWLKMQERKQADSDKSEALMLKLIKLRRNLASVSGFGDFREYCWKKKERSNYTPEQALAMLSAVELHFSDSYIEMIKKQTAYLNLNDFRPWDTHVLLATPTSQRKLTEIDYITLVERAFSFVDADFGKVVRSMADKGHVDLISRENKTSGNFCGTFYTVNEPALSCNFNGDLNQLNTAFHEFGHAVHHSFMNEGTLYFEKGAPYEISEFVATVFQLFAYGLLEEIGFSSEEIVRFRFGMLVNKLNLVKEITALDRLQHWVYTQDVAPTTKDINHAYRQLLANRTENWAGYEEYKTLGWHHPHVISDPFYTVEYVISWIGALIFYESYLADEDEALTALKNAMHLGYSQDAVTLFQVLGVRFPFEKAEIRAAANGLDRLVKAL